MVYLPYVLYTDPKTGQTIRLKRQVRIGIGNQNAPPYVATPRDGGLRKMGDAKRLKLDTDDFPPSTPLIVPNANIFSRDTKETAIKAGAIAATIGSNTDVQQATQDTVRAIASDAAKLLGDKLPDVSGLPDTKDLLAFRTSINDLVEKVRTAIIDEEDAFFTLITTGTLPSSLSSSSSSSMAPQFRMIRPDQAKTILAALKGAGEGFKLLQDQSNLAVTRQNSEMFRATKILLSTLKSQLSDLEARQTVTLLQSSNELLGLTEAALLQRFLDRESAESYKMLAKSAKNKWVSLNVRMRRFVMRIGFASLKWALALDTGNFDQTVRSTMKTSNPEIFEILRLTETVGNFFASKPLAPLSLDSSTVFSESGTTQTKTTQEVAIGLLVEIENAIAHVMDAGILTRGGCGPLEQQLLDDEKSGNETYRLRNSSGKVHCSLNDFETEYLTGQLEMFEAIVLPSLRVYAGKISPGAGINSQLATLATTTELGDALLIASGFRPQSEERLLAQEHIATLIASQTSIKSDAAPSSQSSSAEEMLSSLEMSRRLNVAATKPGVSPTDAVQMLVQSKIISSTIRSKAPSESGIIATSADKLTRQSNESLQTVANKIQSDSLKTPEDIVLAPTVPPLPSPKTPAAALASASAPALQEVKNVRLLIPPVRKSQLTDGRTAVNQIQSPVGNVTVINDQMSNKSIPAVSGPVRLDMSAISQATDTLSAASNVANAASSSTASSSSSSAPTDKKDGLLLNPSLSTSEEEIIAKSTGSGSGSSVDMREGQGFGSQGDTTLLQSTTTPFRPTSPISPISVKDDLSTNEYYESRMRDFIQATKIAKSEIAIIRVGDKEMERTIFARTLTYLLWTGVNLSRLVHDMKTIPIYDTFYSTLDNVFEVRAGIAKDYLHKLNQKYTQSKFSEAVVSTATQPQITTLLWNMSAMASDLSTPIDYPERELREAEKKLPLVYVPYWRESVINKAIKDEMMFLAKIIPLYIKTCQDHGFGPESRKVQIATEIASEIDFFSTQTFENIRGDLKKYIAVDEDLGKAKRQKNVEVTMDQQSPSPVISIKVVDSEPLTISDLGPAPSASIPTAPIKFKTTTKTENVNVNALSAAKDKKAVSAFMDAKDSGNILLSAENPTASKEAPPVPLTRASSGEVVMDIQQMKESASKAATGNLPLSGGGSGSFFKWASRMMGPSSLVQPIEQDDGVGLYRDSQKEIDRRIENIVAASAEMSQPKKIILAPENMQQYVENDDGTLTPLATSQSPMVETTTKTPYLTSTPFKVSENAFGFSQSPSPSATRQPGSLFQEDNEGGPSTTMPTRTASVIAPATASRYGPSRLSITSLQPLPFQSSGGAASTLTPNPIANPFPVPLTKKHTITALRLLPVQSSGEYDSVNFKFSVGGKTPADRTKRASASLHLPKFGNASSAVLATDLSIPDILQPSTTGSSSRNGVGVRKWELLSDGGLPLNTICGILDPPMDTKRRHIGQVLSNTTFLRLYPIPMPAINSIINVPARCAIEIDISLRPLYGPPKYYVLSLYPIDVRSKMSSKVDTDRPTDVSPNSIETLVNAARISTIVDSAQTRNIGNQFNQRIDKITLSGLCDVRRDSPIFSTKTFTETKFNEADPSYLTDFIFRFFRSTNGMVGGNGTELKLANLALLPRYAKEFREMQKDNSVEVFATLSEPNAKHSVRNLNDIGSIRASPDVKSVLKQNIDSWHKGVLQSLEDVHSSGFVFVLPYEAAPVEELKTYVGSAIKILCRPEKGSSEVNRLGPSGYCSDTFLNSYAAWSDFTYARTPSQVFSADPRFMSNETAFNNYIENLKSDIIDLAHSVFNDLRIFIDAPTMTLKQILSLPVTGNEKVASTVRTLRSAAAKQGVRGGEKIVSTLRTLGSAAGEQGVSALSRIRSAAGETTFAIPMMMRPRPPRAERDDQREAPPPVPPLPTLPTQVPQQSPTPQTLSRSNTMESSASSGARTLNSEVYADEMGQSDYRYPDDGYTDF